MLPDALHRRIRTRIGTVPGRCPERPHNSGYRYGRYLVAVALAYTGDNATAESLEEELARDFPEDTLVQFSCGPGQG